uniref:Uncharacterized protein n=1 Tax=Cacopsylla melanoneura TaxID=428564 RepID=A0A8D8RZM5_9HEMI
MTRVPHVFVGSLGCMTDRILRALRFGTIRRRFGTIRRRFCTPTEDSSNHACNEKRFQTHLDSTRNHFDCDNLDRSSLSEYYFNLNEKVNNIESDFLSDECCSDK